MIIHRLNRWCSKIPGTFILRLTLGGVFLFHGVTKLMDMESTIAFFGTIGISALFTWIVALVETIGGALIILGIKVRFAAILLAIIMAYVILFVKNGQGFYAMELDIVLLGLSLGMVSLGCGRYSMCSVGHKNCSDCSMDANCECNCSKNK